MCHFFSFRKLSVGWSSLHKHFAPSVPPPYFFLVPPLLAAYRTSSSSFWLLSRTEAKLAANSHHWIVCFLFTFLATLFQGLGQDIIHSYLLASAQLLLWESRDGNLGLPHPKQVFGLKAEQPTEVNNWKHPLFSYLLYSTFAHICLVLLPNKLGTSFPLCHMKAACLIWQTVGLQCTHLHVDSKLNAVEFSETMSR